MALIKINGRTHFVPANKVTLTKDKPGYYTLTYDHHEAKILGGRHSGGSEREWFFRNEFFFGDRWLPATSLVDAVKQSIVF